MKLVASARQVLGDRDAMGVLYRLAEAYDASPISISSLGERVRDAYYDRRQVIAATDPTWAAIEARRHHRDGTVTFLSDDLDLADYQIQNDIEDRLYPVGALERLALRAKYANVSTGISRVHGFIQRGRRGWSDGDTIDIGSTNAQRLGEQLLFQSKHAEAYPGTDEYPTYESWTAALAHHGQILSTLGGEGAKDQAVSKWHDLATDKNSDPAVVQAALEHSDQVEEDADAAVTASLHWVAEHWKTLWD